jgi:hypothetical protein
VMAVNLLDGTSILLLLLHLIQVEISADVSSGMAREPDNPLSGDDIR